MMRLHTAFFALVLVLASTFALATDVTGVWLMNVDSKAGKGTPTFTLKQEGDKVTGNYKGRMGAWPVTGVVTGNQMTLNYKIVNGPITIDFQFLGTVSGDNVSGKVLMGRLGEGTFTGIKQK